MAQRKKTGFPMTSLHENAQSVYAFSKISTALSQSAELEVLKKVDALTLAKASFQLQTFMESALGKTSSSDGRAMTKIPVSAFNDYAVNGPLHIVLSVALQHQIKAGWDTFDLTSPDRGADGIKILQAAEAALLQVRGGKTNEHKRTGPFLHPL